MDVWRVVCACACVLGASGAVAEGLRTPLKSLQISDLLTDACIEFEGARQYFYASGKTLYIFGEERWGRWTVEYDQYCSQWPPDATWVCYDVFSGAGPRDVIFVGADGQENRGVIEE